MKKRMFTAEVKEGPVDDSCFIWIAADNDVGVGDKSILVKLQEPASLERAKAVAAFLHENVLEFKLSQ